MPVNLAESTPLAISEAPGAGAPSWRFRILLIKAGWGSSGYYSESLLKTDGPRCWPAGTQNYLDHPTETEQREKPERSVKDYASVIVTDPEWDPVEKGLAAEVEVFPQWRGLLNKEFAEKIGLSIRACGVAEYGEAEGREGQIITELTEGISVDWVTKAGAGGKVLQLIESARSAPPATDQQFSEAAVKLTEGRNIGAHMEAQIHKDFTNRADDMYGSGRLTRPERIGLSKAIGKGLDAFTSHVEAEHPQLYTRDLWTEPNAAAMAEARKFREAGPLTANELSTALADAVRETYGGEQIYTWVRDSTDAWVVFTVEDGTDCDLYQQGYTVDAKTQAVTLTGEPAEVIARTTYEPAPAKVETDEGDQLTESTSGTEPTDKKEGIVPEMTEEQVRQLAEAATVKAALDAANTKLAEADKAEADRTAALAESQAQKAASDLELARFRAVEAARPIAATLLTESQLPAPAQVKVLAEAVTSVKVPLRDGVLDEVVFRAHIAEAIKAEETYLASLQEGAGAGQVRGLGESTSTDAAVPDAKATEAALVEAFKLRGMSPEAAQLAASGRRI